MDVQTGMKKIDDANDTKLKDAIVKDVVKALKEQDNDANQLQIRQMPQND